MNNNLNKLQLTWPPFGAPPNKHVLLTPNASPKSSQTVCICWANSRVGDNTNTIGPSPRDNFRWWEICIKAGTIYYKNI